MRRKAIRVHFMSNCARHMRSMGVSRGISLSFVIHRNGQLVSQSPIRLSFIFSIVVAR